MAGTIEKGDPESWRLTLLKNEPAGYSISGTFKKRIIFETTPKDVAIYDVKSGRRLDHNDKAILLTAGYHEIELRRDGLIPKVLQLNITEKSKNKITAVLSRRVRFTALSTLNTQQDAGASLVSLKSGRQEFLRSSRRTPTELTLPAYSYTATFDKAGYDQTQVTFGPESQNVRVLMTPANASVEIQVLDALSGQPISSADIYYNLGDDLSSNQTLFDQTDSQGRGFRQLPAGKYLLVVRTPGFRPLTRTLRAQAGETKSLIFKIYPSN